ncbi:MAG TPA: PEGA domain-containing protein [Rhodothermales bacterium]|nr:PEGA domain-containing protein [Rhodothermales bacterium]
MSHAPQHSLPPRRPPIPQSDEAVGAHLKKVPDWPREGPLYPPHPGRELSPLMGRVGTGLALLVVTLATGFGLVWAHMAKKQAAVETELQRLQEEVMLMEARSPSMNGDGSGPEATDRMHALSPLDARIPLNVYSSPAGAAVSIDGIQVGTTPLLAHLLDPGAYVVSVALGRTSKDQVVVLFDHDVPRNLSFDLRSGATHRKAAPRPQRTEKKVEGTASREDAAPSPPSNPAATTETDTAERAGRGIQVRSSPSGATVQLSGRDVGSTPLDLSAIAPGSYTITISKEGYERWSSHVQVEPNHRVLIHAELKPQPKKTRFGW